MKKALSVVLLAVIVAGPARPVDGARGGGTSRYLDPVVAGGMVFPLARSSWYSVINFRRDWHAPRMRLIGGRWRQVGVHEGNDIFAEPGTPVRAIAGGVVERKGWTFYSGWRVGIRGDDGKYWFYAHLSRFEPGVSVGRRVAAGRRIGSVGNTGYGARPGHSDEFIYHLHVGIQAPDGTWIDPYPLMKRLYVAAVKEQA
jgi:murein DD-endopeptidase MepM/ murein hydrolase activator NlpD